jgi:hypothetical protein
MDLSFNVDDSRNLKSFAEENYFKILTDFFKWTLPITLAAFAWIAANLPPVSNSTKIFYMEGAIVFFALSIITSIIIIYCLLGYWKEEWLIRKKQMQFSLNLRDRTNDVSANMKTRADLQIFFKEFDKWEKTISLNKFQISTAIYIVFLFIGFLLYVVSIIVS